MREWRGSYNGCAIGCIPSMFSGRNEERTDNFSMDIAHIGWITYICVSICIAFFYVLFPHLFYCSAILVFNIQCITIPGWLIGSSRIGKSMLKRGLWYTKRYMEYNSMLVLSNVKPYERGFSIYSKVRESSPQGPFYIPEGMWKNPLSASYIPDVCQGNTQSP